MTIIISKSGKNAIKVEKAGFPQEDYLQKYIYDNPDSIPLYDIDENIRLLILAREFPTQTGPIDALGIDKDGEIYLVETKLYKNPDKRLVVAQVLDYGASLWGSNRDAGQFFATIERSLGGTGFDARVKEYFHLEDTDVIGLRATLKRNLIDGRFRFVVLMDKLHDALKHLIVFINRSSKFQLFAVELEYYRHEDWQIVIPKLFGSEVKGVSDPTAKPTTEQLMTQAEGRNVKSLVEICRGLQHLCVERPEPTHKGSFRYLAKNKDGGGTVVFGINVAGYMPYIPPPQTGELDVWIRPEGIEQATGLRREEIQVSLERDHGAFANKDLGFVVRLKKPEDATKLIAQLRLWMSES